MLPRVSQAYDGPWRALAGIGGEGSCGGDCGQPRLLHSEPALAGPPLGGPGDRSPPKARQLLTDAVAPPRTKAPPPKSSAAGFLAGTNEAALMKIFPGRPRK